MENQFFVDSARLSEAALEKKHRLETDPTSRKDPMEYLPGMEKIESDICEKVISQMKAYDASRYTTRDVRMALEHETCTVEDFKALLSPAAEPFLEQMAQRARMETSKHFGNTVYLFTPLYIANYCENYCVYCGFNCYNDIHRMKLTPEQITEQTVEQNLYTAGVPDPDLIIRPSGEQRLSNFLIWQSAYSEYVFMDVLWPDFTPEHLEQAIAAFHQRQRRFGGI